MLAALNNLNFRIAALRSAINGANYSSDLALYTWPACRGQNDDCNVSHGKILLIPEVLIGRDENLKPFSFCHVKQVTIRQVRPTALVCG